MVECPCGILCNIVWSRSLWMIPYIAGYAYYIIGAFFVKAVVNEIKKNTKLNRFLSDQKKAYVWYAHIVGILDGILYISSLYAGYPQFIAVWLAFKVAGRWESQKLEQEHIEDDTESKNVDMNIRLIRYNAVYNIFTIGNGLSLLLACISWKVSTWIANSLYSKVIDITMLALVAYAIFYVCAKRQTARMAPKATCRMAPKEK